MTPDPDPPADGVALWASAAWRAEASAWLDERLTAAGLPRTGPVTQPRVRPWATVLCAPTARGPVWLKAAGRATAFEAALYELLPRVVPERVLLPIATDAARGWMLLPDGGPALARRPPGPERVAVLADALAAYGRLQRAVEPHAGALLAAGVPDMRPAAMPARFEEALAAVAPARGAAEDPGRRAVRDRLAALAPAVAAWSAQLAASPLAPSLDHNDLHPGNVLPGGQDGLRFYDWGDSVVAHPFAATLVPLDVIAAELEAGPEDPRVLRARDAYLEAFADRGTLREHTETLGLARRLGTIARALTWERAVRSSRCQGEAVPAAWADAPLRTLAALVGAS